MKSLTILGLALPAALAAGPAHAATTPTAPASQLILIGCFNTFSPSVSWSPVSPSQDSWTAGVIGSMSLKGDCTKISAQADLAVTATLAGFTVKPLDVRLTASTDNAQHSSVDLSFLAVGYEIEKITLTDSNTALSNAITFSQMVPTQATSWSKSGSYSLLGGSAGYSLSYSVVGNIAGLVRYSVSPAGIDVGFYGYADARAKFVATGSTDNKVIKAIASGEGSFVLIKASGDASASFVPTTVVPPSQAAATAAIGGDPGGGAVKNAWRVRGDLSYWVQDAIHGTINVHFKGSKPIEFEGNYAVLDYAGLDTTQPWASNLWSFDHTYMKPF
jgi:hypothetical protein